VGAREPPFAEEKEGEQGAWKKLVALQPSQIQDLLRWSKTENRLSTQKYIAVRVYIFFCFCKSNSIKLKVVFHISMSLIKEFAVGWCRVRLV
jgi:uncharacterized membrane protein